MANKGHNKKRNTLLLYEFLIATISRALVEGNSQKSSQALKILKKHFKPGTELFKEFRLMNALVKTTVKSESVASSMLIEAKASSRLHDTKMLDREKSLLIRNINHRLNDETFYDQHVNDYRTLANLQTLVNDWRDPRADISRIAKHEDDALRWLVTERIVVPQTMPEVSTESQVPARLLMRIMMQKLNEKYAGQLTTEQRMLVRAYAFSSVNEDANVVRKRLTEIRETLLERIDEYVGTHPGDEYLKTRLIETREKLVAESFETISDDTVSRFMLYVKLGGELVSGGDDE